MTAATGNVDTTCGFIALVGAPNAGKSTLINQLVGGKVSIVTPKPQTTRSRVLGIRVIDAAQLVFVDTPGIFAPKRRLERAMVAAAWRGAAEADIVVLIVDAERGADSRTMNIVDGLKAAGREAVLVLNKIDLLRRDSLLALSAEFNALGVFPRTFMISALKGDGVADLRDYLAERMPPGPWLYPEDQLSDISERLLAAEITREKLILALRQELPYALTVETESWERFDDGSVKVGQVIYVQRDSQKAIVLGKGGHQVKAVGEASRKELEEIFGHRLHLFLFVKQRANWLDDPERYRALGLEFGD